MKLVWFRKDLRVFDNPALSAACQTGPAIALFISSPWQWQQHNLAPIQLDFMQRNLNHLGQQLAELGISLHHLQVEQFDQVPAALTSFCKAHQVDQVFANSEPELNEQRRDQAVLDLGLPLELYDSHCILPAGAVQTQSGEMFKVFTPFRRRWLEQFHPGMSQTLPSPKAQGTPVTFDYLDLPGEHRGSSAWPAGEDAAHERLERFIQERVQDYPEDRDIPSLDGTSSLSPYLALGILSPRQCLHALLQRQPDALEPGQPAFTWVSELIWREFYRHLLQVYPGLSKGENFQPRASAIAWNQSEADFDAWCKGETGYPLVDAAMRQLADTGWMHNRLRMVVASFLTKHLLIDWRKGEAFFSHSLIDADLASNNGGWQWAASTGCDAQPYFRIFNPIRQSERFDPDGSFIKRYLPQLSELTTRDIHLPPPLLRPDNYPAPLVDHSFARQRALEAYSVLKRA